MLTAIGLRLAFQRCPEIGLPVVLEENGIQYGEDITIRCNCPLLRSVDSSVDQQELLLGIPNS